MLPLKKIILLLLTNFILLRSAVALDYYWVGGSGNWSDLSHWATSSGGTTNHTQLPGSGDAVFFDASSFSASGQTVTVDVAVVNIQKLNWTDPNIAVYNLNLGTATINVSGSIDSWKISSALMNINSGTSVINFNGVNPEFYGGGKTYYNINFNGGNNSTAKIADNNYFHNVILNSNARITSSNSYYLLRLSGGNYYEFKGNSVQTISNTFDANGTCGGFIDMHSDQELVQGIILPPNGSVVTSYLLLKDMAVGNLMNITANNSYDLGDNTNWLTSGFIPRNLYWVGNGGNWNDGNHWSLSSGGAASGCVPSPGDNAIFDANSFSLPGQTVNTNVFYAFCRDMKWLGVTNTPTLDGTSNKIFRVFGSLAFSPGMNLDFQGDFYFQSLFSETITTAGKAFRSNITFDAVVGFWKLMDELNVTKRITLKQGNLNTNDQTVNAFEVWNSVNGFSSLTMGSSVFNISGTAFAWRVNSLNVTVNCGTSVINMTSPSAQFYGQIQTYWDVNFTNPAPASVCDVVSINNFHNMFFAANGTIWGSNTFNNLTLTPGRQYIFVNGKTQTIYGSLVANGNCPANYIDIHSETPGLFSTINKTTGNINGVALRLKDIHAVGGANFIADHSIDQGNNPGWNFTNSTVSDPGPISGPSSACQGATGLVFQIAAVAGATSYQWTVPPGATIVSGQGTIQITVDMGTASSGTISVQAFAPCSQSANSSVFAITVTAGTTPTVNIISNPSTPICNGSLISITAAASTNGTGNINYDFRINGTTVQSSASNVYNSAIWHNGDIVNCLITISGGSCLASTNAISNTIIISSAAPPSLSIQSSANNICIGTNVTFIATPINAGTGTTYQWQLNGVNVGANSGSYFNNNLANGDQVKCIMSTTTPCVSFPTVGSNTLTMVVYEKPAIRLSPLNPTILAGESIRLNASATGNNLSYLWTPSTGLNNPNISNPVASPLTKTNYHLKVTATGNCSADTSMTVDVLSGIYIPNSFVPGGVNNIFRIPPRTAIRDLQYFTIYNRYGNMVFLTNNINSGWDGNFKGKPADQGVYTYIIKARDANGPLILKGTVNLIR